MTGSAAFHELENMSDFKKDLLQIGGQEVWLFYLDTLVDAIKTKQYLLRQVELLQQTASPICSDQSFLHSISGKPVAGDFAAPVLQGLAILFIPSSLQAVQFTPLPVDLERSIDQSQLQSVIVGPQTSFTEELDSNIGLLRKQIVSTKLIGRNITLGTNIKRKASLFYLEGTAAPELVEKVWDAILQRQDTDHFTTQAVYKTLQQKWWNPFPTIFSTDQPMEAGQMLRDGRVLLFLDQFPVALVVPGMFQDMLFLTEDRNYPQVITYFLRILRVLALIISLTAPALYVALIAVNPEVLRIELALSIAQSREGVPYPAMVEVLLMMLVLELVREASVRLPRSIGPTVTMVGGIVLGQAVVQAQLVSNLLIIVISALSIANSSIIGVQSTIAIRIFKYLLLVITGIFGFVGMFIGIAGFIVFLSHLITFGVPYFSKRKEPDISHG